jgi:hypothetical protein
MVWVFLVLAAVGWLVVTLISEQERGEAVPISAKISAGALRLKEQWPRIAATLSRVSHRVLAWLLAVTISAARTVEGSARGAFDRARARTSAGRPGMSFRADSARRHGGSGRLPGDGWRSRLVALLQLILFVVLISALFAGAIAAAAMRIGHLGT